jgi:hypothetical protein
MRTHTLLCIRKFRGVVSHVFLNARMHRIHYADPLTRYRTRHTHSLTRYACSLIRHRIRRHELQWLSASISSNTRPESFPTSMPPPRPPATPSFVSVSPLPHSPPPPFPPFASVTPADFIPTSVHVGGGGGGGMSRSEVGGAGEEEEEEMVVGSRVRTYRCGLPRTDLLALLVLVLAVEFVPTGAPLIESS